MKISQKKKIKKTFKKITKSFNFVLLQYIEKFIILRNKKIDFSSLPLKTLTE